MSRQSKLAEQIRRELSVLIQMELRDPRLGMVTLTAVELTRDYSLAKVFFTVFEEDKVDDSLAVLQSSSGFLRHALRDRISMRSLPQLQFRFDTSIDRARKISSLIDQAVAQDKNKQDQDQE